MPNVVVSPAQALTKLYNINPRAAGILYAGIGIFAAAAIVIAFNIDLILAARVGVGVLVLGLCLIAVANLPQIIGQVLGTVVVAILIAFLLAITTSILFLPPWPKPLVCIVYPLEPCNIAGGPADALAERQAAAEGLRPEIPAAIADPAPVSTAGPERTAATAPANKVFIQFAGVITRESVASLASALRNGGWRVQGASGERTSAAAGLNEVRYGDPRDAAAAQTLAAAVTATKITSGPVTAKHVPIVKSNLELWISN